jgi:hypothetical protein
MNADPTTAGHSSPAGPWNCFGNTIGTLLGEGPISSLSSVPLVFQKGCCC